MRDPDPTYIPGLTLEMLERVTILSCLRYHNGCRSKAARDLGISRRTLFSRISRYAEQGHVIPPPTTGVKSEDPTCPSAS